MPKSRQPAARMFRALLKLGRWNVEVHELHSASLAATLFVVLHCANCAPAQSAPVSSDRPWHSPAERNIEADLRDIPDSRFTIDSAKTYSCPDLIAMSESHNPATRESW